MLLVRWGYQLLNKSDSWVGQRLLFVQWPLLYTHILFRNFRHMFGVICPPTFSGRGQEVNYWCYWLGGDIGCWIKVVLGWDSGYFLYRGPFYTHKYSIFVTFVIFLGLFIPATFSGRGQEVNYWCYWLGGDISCWIKVVLGWDSGYFLYSGPSYTHTSYFVTFGICLGLFAPQLFPDGVRRSTIDVIG